MSLPGRPGRGTPVDRAWVRGFATALAEVHRLLAHGNDASGICRIAREAGVDLASARAAGVSLRDIATLREAGVPQERT